MMAGIPGGLSPVDENQSVVNNKQATQPADAKTIAIKKQELDSFLNTANQCFTNAKSLAGDLKAEPGSVLLLFQSAKENYEKAIEVITALNDLGQNINSDLFADVLDKAEKLNKHISKKTANAAIPSSVVVGTKIDPTVQQAKQEPIDKLRLLISSSKEDAQRFAETGNTSGNPGERVKAYERAKAKYQEAQAAMHFFPENTRTPAEEKSFLEANPLRITTVDELLKHFKQTVPAAQAVKLDQKIETSRKAIDSVLNRAQRLFDQAKADQENYRLARENYKQAQTTITNIPENQRTGKEAILLQWIIPERLNFIDQLLPLISLLKPTASAVAADKLKAPAAPPPVQPAKPETIQNLIGLIDLSIREAKESIEKANIEGNNFLTCHLIAKARYEEAYAVILVLPPDEKNSAVKASLKAENLRQIKTCEDAIKLASSPKKPHCLDDAKTNALRQQFNQHFTNATHAFTAIIQKQDTNQYKPAQLLYIQARETLRVIPESQRTETEIAILEWLPKRVEFFTRMLDFLPQLPLIANATSAKSPQSAPVNYGGSYYHKPTPPPPVYQEPDPLPSYQAPTPKEI